MVLYHFPPVESIASNRARRLIGHLPLFNVEPVVVTGTTGPESDNAVRTSLAGLDDSRIRIIRVRGRDPIAWFQRRSDTGTQGRSDATPRWKRLKRLLRSAFIPDDKRGWIPAWIQGGISAAADGIDIVFSSSAPYSTHVAGRYLASELDVPWVMEMRDLWSGNRYIPQTDNPISRRLTGIHERRSLSRAERIIVPSAAHAHYLAIRNRSIRKRIHVVPNMFDEPVSEHVPHRSSPDAEPLRLLYAGGLYGGRTLESLGRAVDAITTPPGRSDSARLEVAGRSFDLPWSAVLGGAGDNRVIHGFLRQDELSELMSQVHVGVIHNPSWDSVHIPGKLYEYMGAGLPILDLTTQPDIPEVCRGTVPCWKVDPHDQDRLTAILHEITDWWIANPNGVPRPGIGHRFSSRSVSRQLAGLFQTVVHRDNDEPRDD